MFKVRSLTLDVKKKQPEFQASKSAEQDFYRQLKKVAQTSGHIVEGHVEGATVKDPKGMQEALERYADLITPWARRQSAKLLDQVQKKNKRAYKNKANQIGKALNSQLASDQFIGALALDLMNEQVNLIRSIPIEAGLRAQNIAMESYLHGMRAEPNQDTIDELKNQLGLSTEVAVSRAKRIAVCETYRANASFTQARATSAGSRGYIWETTMDGAERHSHALMNGKYVEYAHIPTLSDGTKGHAGTLINCRCWQNPVFSD